MIDSGLFVGALRRRRFTPVAHAFTYPLFMALSLERRPWSAAEIRRALVCYPAMTATVMAGFTGRR